MRKPDIFDEIIQYLSEEAMRTPRTTVSAPTLKALLAKTDAPAAPGKAPAYIRTQYPDQSAPRRNPPAPVQAPAAQMRRPAAPPAPIQAQVPPPQRQVPPQGYPQSVDNRTWEELEQAVAGCRQCPLCETRNKVVFGDGNRQADLMFIGEGPGADEDAQGLPFVGKAGMLLTKIIEAMQFKRSEVYIGNIVKCRPPENRTPRPEEADICKPFILRQIELIHPKVIVLLGATPANYILNCTEHRITHLRGHWMEYNGIRIMPTFHPAYLLRNEAAKKDVWQDMQQVMKVFGKVYVRPQR